MNNGTCTICPADQYKAGTNAATSCTACATGHSTNSVQGSTAASNCTRKY